MQRIYKLSLFCFALNVDIFHHKTVFMHLQDVMGDYVGLLRYCTFPVSRFAGHCESSREPGGTMNDLVTYHANCVSGTHKYENLRRVVTGALSNKQVL